MSASPPIWRWRGWTRSAPGSRCSSLSAARDGHTPGLFVAQDTGSGGSWPISSDRVVWFLAARHLLEDRAFADQVWQALKGTLAQDRAMVFDAQVGLYRGETSFLDWREQTYPDWTREDVRFIGDSYALSTNVLHYQALRLAERLAGHHGDARAADYKAWADALAQQIDARFWREDIGQYMSYIGEAAHPVPYAKVDLLGLSLSILAGLLPPERARRALAAYPMGPAGSPVVWPQEAQQPIYHNRAIWPFVSAYSLRAARQLDDAPRIAAEIRSLMRGAALAGSNMENYELVSQAVHVEEGALSGPVVNSERQLWSVAGYLSMVVEGVFGVQDDGRVQPKLPAALVPELFGTQRSISLEVTGKRYVLERPQSVGDGLLVAGRTTTRGTTTTVQLVTAPAATGFAATTADANARAPATPAAPQAPAQGHGLERSGASRAGSVEGRQGRRRQQRPGADQRRWAAALPQPDPTRRRVGIAAQPNGLRRSAAGAEGCAALAIHLGQGRAGSPAPAISKPERADQHRRHGCGQAAGAAVPGPAVAAAYGHAAAQRGRAGLDLGNIHGAKGAMHGCA